MDTLYDRDFLEWTEAQADAIRRLRDIRPKDAAGVDWDNLIEEILDMGRSIDRAYRSFVVQIIVHLLKLEFSPASDPRRHWTKEVAAFRIAADDEAERAPSVRRRIDLSSAYRMARRLAAVELQFDDVPERIIPATCPYDLDTQILADGWFPANRHGHRP